MSPRSPSMKPKPLSVNFLIVPCDTSTILQHASMDRAHGRAVVQTSGWPGQTEGFQRNLRVREQTDRHNWSTTATAALDEAPVRRRAESTRRGAGGRKLVTRRIPRDRSGGASRSAFAVLGTRYRRGFRPLGQIRGFCIEQARRISPAMQLPASARCISASSRRFRRERLDGR